MADKSITMNINEVLELDFVIEQVSDNTIDITDEPTAGSSTMSYIDKRAGIFNPSETGIHQLDINGQTVEIDVVDIPDTVVDDFEDGNISEYSGDTGLFSVSTSNPLEGDNSLRSTEDTFSGIVSTTGLDAYPAKGDEFSYLVEPRGSATATTPLWGASDLDNYYSIRLDTRTTDVNFIVRSGGESNLTTLFTASITSGQTYEVVVEWHDGSGSEPDNTIVITVYEYDTTSSDRGAEVGGGSVSDTTHEARTGIGFRTFGDSGNTENIYDFCGIWGPVD